MIPRAGTLNPMDQRERFAVAYDAAITGFTGRAVPYNVPNGRPGRMWAIDAKGAPQFVEYASSVFEPGCFAAWFAASGRNEIKFLYQHGDATQGWDFGVPMGVNALPVGTITAVEDRPDGCYVTGEFAHHSLAEAIRELFATGALHELSACTVALTAELRPAADGSGDLWRYISQAELWEVSAVVWGQYGLNAAVTEVFSNVRELLDAAYVNTMPEPSTGTVVGVLGAALYDALTDIIQDWLEDNVITVDEFVPLSTLITTLVSTLDAGLDTIGIADRSVPDDCDDDEMTMALRLRERFSGAAISAANAKPLLAACTDMRAFAQALTDHADAIESMMASSSATASGDEPATATARVELEAAGLARYEQLEGKD